MIVGLLGALIALLSFAVLLSREFSESIQRHDYVFTLLLAGASALGVLVGVSVVQWAAKGVE